MTMTATTRTPPTCQRIDPASSTAAAPQGPWELSARALAALAERPPARKLVTSIWAELDELERTGQLPDLIATVRAILIEHQILTYTGRCRGCRRGARRSWKFWRRSFPCEVWFTVHLGLQGLFTRAPVGPAEQNTGRHAVRSSW